MTNAGADSSGIEEFLRHVECVRAPDLAVVLEGVPEASSRFMKTTWEVIRTQPIHCRAAAFAFGREDLTPEMFEHVVSIDDHGGGLGTFVDYLSRRIEVDGEQHTPMAMLMLVTLCGDDGAFPREGGHAVIDHAASVSLAVWCRRSYALGLRWPLAECRRRVL